MDAFGFQVQRLLAKKDVDKSSLCPSCVHAMAASHYVW